MNSKNDELTKETGVSTEESQSVKFAGILLTEGKSAQFVLKIKDYISGEEVEATIDRDKFNPANLNRLVCVNNGICTSTETACTRIEQEFIAAVKAGALEVKNTHLRLGWHECKDEIVFYGDRAYSENAKIDSIYAGRRVVKAHGTLDKLSNMISKWITNQEEWSTLEAIIAVAVAATVLPYANLKWETVLNNLILHMLGGSTTGKTTALTLFTSFGSKPIPKKGFWIHFGSTCGAIIKRIGDNFGFPVAIDELSSGKTQQIYDEFVYTVGNGEEKDRLMAGGSKFQDSATFSTIALTSGEVSLIQKCSKNEGIRVRCVELVNESWTSSKEQAEAITNCARKNYGLVVPEVVKELLSNGDSWGEKYKEWRKKIAAQMENDKIKLAIGARIMDYVALFSLSAEIANVVLGVKLDVNKISKFWYEYIIINNAEDANLAERAYDAIKNFIAYNSDRIEDASVYGGCRTMNDTIYLPTESVGFSYNARIPRELEGVKCTRICVFMRDQFSKILTNAGFSDERVVLKRLKDGKYLMTHDARRATKKYWINKSEVECIAVFVPDEEIDLNNHLND